jgi:DnaJ-class molecular chaperone
MNEWQLHCKILSVASDASMAEIKRAYHASAKLLHPDVHQNSPLAKEKFQQLKESYDYLLQNTGRHKNSHTGGATSTNTSQTQRESSSASSRTEEKMYEQPKRKAESQPLPDKDFPWESDNRRIAIVMTSVFVAALIYWLAS